MTWQEWVDWLKNKRSKETQYTKEKKNLRTLHIKQLNAIKSEECQKNKETAEYYGKLINQEKVDYKDQLKQLHNRFFA